jgi:peptide/nickel transport system permease protein
MMTKIKEQSANSFLLKNFSNLGRFMDSFAVLVGVSTITFLIVRLNLTINKIEPLILGLLAVIGVLALSFSQIRRKLFWLGVLAASILAFYPVGNIFPSFKEPSATFLEGAWKSFVFPLIWFLIIAAYALRSWFSRSKILLSCLGFVFLLIMGQDALGATLAKTKFNPKLNFKPPIILKSGDPLADLRLNPSVKPEALKREEARLGLDKPLWRQYLLWLDGIFARADFGLTQQGEPVIDTIRAPLFNTILLNIFVLLFTWLIGVPLGVFAGIKSGKFLDKLILTFSSLSITMPAFLLTIFALAFAINMGIGQVGGLTSVYFSELSPFQKVVDVASHLMLPVAILTFISLGGLIRQMRGNLLDVLNEDYIKAARARGIPERKIFWGHALQNAINPLITLLGFEFAALISGAALTEMILAYPGIGAMTLEAAKRLDINLIMFNLLLGTVMLMLGNAMSDWLLSKVDPRVRS